MQVPEVFRGFRGGKGQERGYPHA